MKYRVWSKKLNDFYKSCLLDQNGYILSTWVSTEDNKNFQTHLLLLNPEENVIQRFTGLIDKNKQEIYEGDIVKYKYAISEHELEEGVGEVYFEDGMFLFDRKMEFAMNDCNFYKEYLEVVGNIFITPKT